MSMMTIWPVIVNQVNLVQPYNMLLQIEKCFMNDSSRHLLEHFTKRKGGYHGQKNS